MARLIVKSPYLKGSGKGGYAKYIATRDGVEKLEQQPSGYAAYMARRPRSHGLFGDEDCVDLDKALREIDAYPGNIWTHILSLKREDAARLGYDHAAPWRNLLRAHRGEIAQAMRIPPQDFRWYAAFHDEGDHPHVHMMAWSAKPGQAYLSPEGIRKIKSVLTNDIFQQEMLHTYEQKSASRDELVRESRRAIRELARQMREGVCDAPGIEPLMRTLVTQLETVRGKKKYGYLPKRVKETVRKIVDEMERLPAVHDCYQTWWALQCEIEDYYAERARQRPSLSERKEFRPILNAVIREAERVRRGAVTFEDRGIEDEREDEELASAPQTLWRQIAAYQEAKAVLGDDAARWSEKEEAVRALEVLWDEGLTVAAHQLGKCWRDGLGVMPDDEKAEVWFRKSAEAGNDFSQYALGKLLQQEGRVEEAVEWYEQAADQGNQYAQYALGKLYLTGRDVPRDREAAWRWFTQSADQGNAYAQFFLDRWDTLAQPDVMLAATRLLHHLSRVFRENTPANSAAGMVQGMDRKRRQQLNEIKLARGQRVDDHSGQDFTMGGMTM